MAGSARLKLDDEEVELVTWDAIRVSPTVTRGMQGGPEGAEILASAPPPTSARTWQWSASSGRSDVPYAAVLRSPSAASTSSSCVLGEALGMTWRTTPSSSMRKVARCAPQ